MSTYYKLRCPICGEQGGFFSRQMWGWGNCDIFGTFKVLVAHHDCGTVEIISEHHDSYYSDEELRWLERLSADEFLRDRVWPHATEWGEVAESWPGSHDWLRRELAEDLEGERRSVR